MHTATAGNSTLSIMIHDPEHFFLLFLSRRIHQIHSDVFGLCVCRRIARQFALDAVAVCCVWCVYLSAKSTTKYRCDARIHGFPGESGQERIHWLCKLPDLLLSKEIILNEALCVCLACIDIERNESHEATMWEAFWHCGQFVAFSIFFTRDDDSRGRHLFGLEHHQRNTDGSLAHSFPLFGTIHILSSMRISWNRSAAKRNTKHTRMSTETMQSIERIFAAQRK